eukprot:5835811-Pyramimonas_sp.AAC.1
MARGCAYEGSRLPSPASSRGWRTRWSAELRHAYFDHCEKLPSRRYAWRAASSGPVGRRRASALPSENPPVSQFLPSVS